MKKNQTTFKKGQTVWIMGENRKARFLGYNRNPHTATVTVRFITNNSNGESEVDEFLHHVKLKDLRIYSPKKRKKRKPLQIRVKYFDKDIPEEHKLNKITVGDWIDLRASELTLLKKGEYALIPLGVGMKLPKGFEANIVPRSSTFKNFDILQTNSFGVIDNSYSGNEDQWFFPALAMKDTIIDKGDRICQFRINRIMPDTELIEVEFLDEESRGGIGSTGVE